MQPLKKKETLGLLKKKWKMIIDLSKRKQDTRTHMLAYKPQHEKMYDAAVFFGGCD